jgi:hypothetical protein
MLKKNSTNSLVMFPIASISLQGPTTWLVEVWPGLACNLLKRNRIALLLLVLKILLMT